MLKQDDSKLMSLEGSRKTQMIGKPKAHLHTVSVGHATASEHYRLEWFKSIQEIEETLPKHPIQQAINEHTLTVVSQVGEKRKHQTPVLQLRNVKTLS